MGASESSEHSGNHHTKHNDKNTGILSAVGDNTFQNLYDSLISHGKLSKDLLKAHFGPQICDALFLYFGEGCDLADFTHKIRCLTGTSGDQCVHMLFRGCDQYDRYGIEWLLYSCWNCSGDLQSTPGDDEFIASLATNLVGSADHDVKVTPSDVILWKNCSCPLLTQRMQLYLNSKCHQQQWKHEDYPLSHVLTPMQLWFIHSALPQPFIPPHDFCWKPLLISSEHGLSYRSFEKHVLGYKGYTVAVLELTDGEIFVLGVDEEWRDSSQPWGKSNCTLIQLVYKFGIRAQGTSIVFFNSKARGLPNKLTVGNPKQPALSVPSDFSNLHSLEVYGCSGEAALTAQKHQKEWEGRQIEKQKKVPLPGNWDENPDRSLLEMAGISKVPAEFSRD